MNRIAIAVPIKPGKAKLWKERTRQLMNSRRGDVEDDWRRFGIHRSTSWLQRTSQGDIAILYWEVDDPRKLQERTEIIMTSDDEYYVELRESLTDIFEVEPGQSRPSPELVSDFCLNHSNEP